MKLVEEKGCKKAGEELEISYPALYDPVKQTRNGNLHAENRSISNYSELEDEIQQLRRANKKYAKVNKIFEAALNVRYLKFIRS